jgi:hypothetical protein
MTDFSARVIAAGSDPACPHCQLSVVLTEYLAGLPGGRRLEA